MALILLTLLLGIGNFAMHKAVLESRHPMLAQMPWMGLMGGRFSLALEFLLLVGALLLLVSGHPGWALAYLAYSALNAIAPEDTRISSVPAVLTAASRSTRELNASSEIPPASVVRDEEPTLTTMREARGRSWRWVMPEGWFVARTVLFYSPDLGSWCL